jgi:hypothetical protein
MNARSTPWLVAAVLEAVAITWLAWIVFADAAPAAAEVHVPTGPATAEPPTQKDPVVHPASVEPTMDAAAAVRSEGAASTAAAGAPVAPMNGCLVHGVVRMQDGSAVPGVTLSLMAGDATAAVARTSLSAGNLAFAWAEVEPGDYELAMRGEGVRESTQKVVVPPGVADLRVDVVLERSWLVRVLLTTPDGKPLHEVLSPELQLKMGMRFGAGVQLIALWQPIPDDLPQSGLRDSPLTIAKWKSSREIGRGTTTRELPARYAGVLEMPESRDAFVAAVWKEVVLARASLAKDQQELELVVDPARLQASLATLRLVVVDRDGKPLPGAKVGVNDRQSGGQPTAVDADGRYEKSDLAPGLFTLTVSCEGHRFAPHEITLRPGAVVDLGQVQALSSREVTIRLAGAAEGKEPRGGMRLLETASHAALRPLEHRLSFRNGEAKLGLVDGRYLLQVRGAGGARRIVDTRALGDGPLVVELQPEATLQVDSSATPTPTRLVLTTEDGAVVHDRWVTWRSRWDLPLLPGRYQVATTPLGGSASTRSLDVPSEGAKLVL